MHPAPSKSGEYENSLAAEVRIYRDCLNVHSLPRIFHHWSNHHLLPALKALGMAGPVELFAQNLAAQFDGASSSPRRFVSLGSGNCDLEILLALRLRNAGSPEFVIDCVDLNPAMLERGRMAAERAGTIENFSFVQGDLNAWSPRDEYHAVIANQSLHHVLNLETLFTEVKRSLRPSGVFVISDIIGRNGHLRWPEALQIVQRFWRLLPPSYRWNRQAGAYEELFEDHDCSGVGFEGVRSQDILPLLLEDFHFRFFFPFGNAIDPFIDRSFGPNFNPDRECDRAFIDRIHQCDQFEMASGRLTPTHMMAVVTKEDSGPSVFPGNLSPSFCVRSPDASPTKTVFIPGPIYQWEQWPETAHGELEKACGMLVDSANLIRRQTAWAISLEREAAQRLEWGEDLTRQIGERTQWALKLDSEMRARTAWALNLQREVADRTESISLLHSRAAELQADFEERTTWALRVERELAERTTWALRLQADLAEQTGRAAGLDREIHAYLRNPLRLLLRMAMGIRNRMRRNRAAKIQL